MQKEELLEEKKLSRLSRHETLKLQLWHCGAGSSVATFAFWKQAESDGGTSMP